MALVNLWKCLFHLKTLPSAAQKFFFKIYYVQKTFNIVTDLTILTSFQNWYSQLRIAIELCEKVLDCVLLVSISMFDGSTHSIASC